MYIHSAYKLIIFILFRGPSSIKRVTHFLNDDKVIQLIFRITEPEVQSPLSLIQYWGDSLLILLTFFFIHSPKNSF